MSRAKGSARANKDGPKDRFADLILSDDLIQTQIEKDWPLLDPKSRAFAEGYLVNGYKHREAATDAGFPAGEGIRLVRKPLIRAYIASVQSRMFESEVVTKDFIDSKLDELFDMAMGYVEVPLVDAKSGTEFEARKFHGSLALEIIREKSKMNGITKPDVGLEDVMGAFASAVRGNLPSEAEK